MIRTVQRYSLAMNTGKWQQLCQIARLYRDEKNFHLGRYNQAGEFAQVESERTRRDELVAEKYQPATGLQARQWKIANKSAYETVLKNWKSFAARLKGQVRKHKGTRRDAAMHCAYWLLNPILR